MDVKIEAQVNPVKGSQAQENRSSTLRTFQITEQVYSSKT
jgi:hypothetical protein